MVDNKNSGETHSISPTGSAWCISSRRTETGDLPISSRNDKQHSATKPTKKKKELTNATYTAVLYKQSL